jgi:hypothetical protein
MAVLLLLNKHFAAQTSLPILQQYDCSPGWAAFFL